MTEVSNNSFQRVLSDSPYNLKYRNQNASATSTRTQPPLNRELSDTPFYKNRTNEVRKPLVIDDEMNKKFLEFQRQLSFTQRTNTTAPSEASVKPSRRKRDSRRVVSLDSSALQMYKESKKKIKKSKRSVSAGEDQSSIMNRLSFENIDVVNTPLSANRSCSEYNRTAVPEKSILTVEKPKPKSFWSSMFSWKSSSEAKKVKVDNKVHFTPEDDEQSYRIQSMRFNQANLTEDELADFADYVAAHQSVAGEPNCLSFSLSGPSACAVPSSSSAAHRSNSSRYEFDPYAVNDKKKKRKSSFNSYSIMYESSVALDYLFGLNHYTNSYGKNADMVMEIELKTLKEPELLEVYTVGGNSNHSSNHALGGAAGEATDRESFGLPRILNLADIMGINNGLGLATSGSGGGLGGGGASTGNFSSLRRITSLRSLERHSEAGGMPINILAAGDVHSDHGSERRRSSSVNSQNRYALLVPKQELFNLYDWKTYQPAAEQLMHHLANKVRAFYPTTRQDDFFYESIRIQPFSSGAYLRGMLWAGFCSLFFNIYNFVSWPQLNEATVMSGSLGVLPLTPYHYMFENVLYCGLVIQLILNLLQLPFRLKIHFQCWESSRAVEVDVAINVIRTMLLCDSWYLNKALGNCLDALSLLNLIVTELYLWSSEHNDPLRSLVVSLCATNLLAFVSRIIVATAFSLSMHDPQVLSDARRRGLSKWDLDVLPTFFFAHKDEVNNDDCSICLGNFDIGEMLISLPCDQKHSFHAVCIRQWLQRQNSCPLCQKLV